MDVSLLAFEWTDTSRHWLIEVPIRIVAYVAVALVVRLVLQRMIDRATTGRNPKEKVLSTENDAADKRLRTPPLVRRLRDRVPATATSEQVLLRRQQRAQTIGSVMKSTVSIVLLVWVALAVLNVLGVNIAPFIASAGVVGLAIGFGAQNLVRDFVTGVFMLLEDQYGSATPSTSVTRWARWKVSACGSPRCATSTAPCGTSATARSPASAT